MVLPKNDEQVTIRLPKRIRQAAEKKAEADGRSLSAWIRQLVFRETGNNEPKAEPIVRRVQTRFKSEKS